MGCLMAVQITIHMNITMITITVTMERQMEGQLSKTLVLQSMKEIIYHIWGIYFRTLVEMIIYDLIA